MMATVSFDSRFLQAVIEEINSTIDVSLKLAFEDFTIVSEFIKWPANEEISRLMSPIVKELQYYDIFLQKAEHIKNIHLWILHDIATNSARDLSVMSKPVNVLRLNQLQYQVTIVDYVNAVTRITELFEMAGQKEEKIKGDKRFAHTRLIQAAGRIIDSKFTYAANFSTMWNVIGVREKLVLINKLYSMESERFVLDAYLQKPSINVNEIRDQNTNQRNTEPEIDLF